ncbi:hypothetical protein LX16_0916 [Stackebrandtia albiflava]|uniref:Uncharacterized protein n=1 Tax=Stackebrandtia albiflava TaxID=406432 RepID=A0A562VBF2_9ACTN|nr:hypothetical protein LX16_0916 [Stackebrandtia albiflava]
MASGTIGCCGSSAMRCAASRGRNRQTSAPPAVTVPESGRCSLARVRSRVDLPHPLGPTTEVTVPDGTVRVTSSTAVTPGWEAVMRSMCSSTRCSSR